MLIFGPEEKANWEYSISNLATLKTFHDTGLDVSSLSDFMMDLNYNDSTGKKIFEEGCKYLFLGVTEYSPYEDDSHNAILERYKELGGLISIPEYAFEIKDPKIDKILDSSHEKAFKDFIINTTKETITDESCFYGEIINLPDGFVITMETLGQFHEIAQTIVFIYREMNRLYELLVKGENIYELSN